MSTKPKPVKDNTLERAQRLAEQHRLAHYNRLYYADRLTKNQTWSTRIEFTLALLAPGVLGSWAVFESGVWEHLWKFLAGAAGVIMVLKPLFRHAQKIERYSKLWTAYNTLASEVDISVADLWIQKEWNDIFEKQRVHWDQRLKDLFDQDDAAPDPELQDALRAKVNRQFPTEYYWVPEA